MTGDESGVIRETSRRVLLKNALLLGAGAASVGVTSALGANAAQAASTRLGIKFGAMHHIYPDWVTKAPSPYDEYSERRYFDTPNFIPKDWAATGCHSDYVTISIRPKPDDLLHNRTIPNNGSGYTTLDGQIRHLLSTCPDHVELTSWHEAQSDNPLHYPGYITPKSLTAIHQHMQQLCSKTPDANRGRVKYGCILTGPASGINAKYLGEKLDWYGIDIYDGKRFRDSNGNLSQDRIMKRMDDNLTAWRTAAKRRSVSVRITETNSARDDHRKNWMRFLSEWMAANNGYRIVTFWGGTDSGHWPPSETVLDYYSSLQRQYGAKGSAHTANVLNRNS
jgi:hypothetical protein